jgi:glutamyl-tRNA(Gln) amidotransferase subunit E
MTPVEEIHVMRKTVIDGSNTTGFQRTAFVARDGYIDTTAGRVRVNMLLLEEDAARKMREEGDKVFFRLDRLGIPLVELRTEPDIFSPEQLRECAERLGLLTRMTGKTKRGIGTIRQDINISIPGGNRVEIKGAQDLPTFPRMVEIEIDRQKALLQIKANLARRKIPVQDVKATIVDITSILSKSQSEIVKRGLKGIHKALAVKLPGFSGLLGIEVSPNRSFGAELSDYVKIETGLRGLIHSDELPGYGITSEETELIAQAVGVESSEDGFALVFADETIGQKGIQTIVDRSKAAFSGVPREVRGPNPDGTTRYQRPMPGGARMYPETDHPPILISDDLIQKVDAELPETPEEKATRFINDGLGTELASQLIRSRNLSLFEDLASAHKLSSKFIASLFLTIDSTLRKEYDIIDPLVFKFSILSDVFSLVEDNTIAKEAVVPVLAELVRNPQLSSAEAISKIGVERADEDEIATIIRKVVRNRIEFIKERQIGALGPLMGVVMKELSGKAEGKQVSNLLQQEIQKALETQKQ